jgi:hypothetical protein
MRSRQKDGRSFKTEDAAREHFTQDIEVLKRNQAAGVSETASALYSQKQAKCLTKNHVLSRIESLVKRDSTLTTEE